MMDRKDLVVESSDSRPQADHYVIVGNYRLVKPYHFDFVCNVRQRWQGRSIIDIFSKEFPARDKAYYLQALADGRLRVEGREVGPDTPLKDGMRMRHFIHRHEPPAPAGSIQVVGETPDIVAVCKPHGMPVHVAGQYRKNTVHGILQAERPDLGELLPVHRLDKPVSGLLLFARHAASAEALRQKIEGRTVEKIYVARVLGSFPSSEEPILVDVPLAWDPVSNHATAVPLEGAGGAEQAQQAQQPGAEQVQGQAVAGEGGGAGPADLLAAEGQMDVDGTPQQKESAAAANGAPCSGAGKEGGEQQGAGGTAAQGVGGFESPPQGGVCLQDQQQQQQQQQQQAGKRSSRRERRAAKRERQATAAAGQQRQQAQQPQQLPPGKGGKREAKPAATLYKLLWVAPDGQTSLVECRPLTGRTHQIRVHLQYLGHPIANDTQYGGTFVGPLPSRAMAEQLGVSWDKHRRSSETMPADADAAAAAAAAAAGEGGGAAAKRARTESGAPAARPASQQQQQQHAQQQSQQPQQTPQQQQQQPIDPVPQQPTSPLQQAPPGDVYAQNRAFRSSPEFEAPPSLHDPLCIHCPYFAPRDYPLDLRPLWLHARTYSCQGGEWSFSTALPDWAREDFVPA